MRQVQLQVRLIASNDLPGVYLFFCHILLCYILNIKYKRLFGGVTLKLSSIGTRREPQGYRRCSAGIMAPRTAAAGINHSTRIVRDNRLTADVISCNFPGIDRKRREQNCVKKKKKTRTKHYNIKFINAVISDDIPVSEKRNENCGIPTPIYYYVLKVYVCVSIIYDALFEFVSVYLYTRTATRFRKRVRFSLRTHNRRIIIII